MTTVLPESNAPPLLELRGIRKQFAGTVALYDVRVQLHAGELLGLVGENGAGKSTLMRILAGIVQPDSGEILLAGRPIQIADPNEASRLGIAMIHQEIHLCPNLDVAANIYLGREQRRWGWLATRTMRRGSMEHMRRVGLAVPPQILAGKLPLGQQQLVEIARALSTHARILILDEPTSSLSTAEAAKLFQTIAELKRAGVAMIYISHRLGEIEQLADRVSVLRDGRNAGELSRQEVQHERMVQLMIGRDIRRGTTASPPIHDETALEVQNLCTVAFPDRRVNLRVRKGECVGLAGLVGAGRTELLTTIFGITPAKGGVIRVGPRRETIHHPSDAVQAGLALVPEDRKLAGLVLPQAILPNVALASIDRYVHFRQFVRDRKIRADVQAVMDRLSLRAASLERQPVQSLSGGNQQKVVIGKWLLCGPAVLLMDEPTRGVDVGARQELYDYLRQQQAQGTAILFASSEMEEVLTLADRIVVMHEGGIAGELTREQATEESVMLLATGKSNTLN